MKKSEIIKDIKKLYMNQFLAMATPGTWNLSRKLNLLRLMPKVCFGSWTQVFL